MKLVVEQNQRVLVERTMSVGPMTVMVTPDIGEDYWLLRVPLTDKNAIVAFPKFGTFGIGFQQETDWNTNLPYVCDAERIWDHIKHNKGDSRIRRGTGIAAIKLLQQTLREMRNEKPHRCSGCGRTSYMHEDETNQKGCVHCGNPQITWSLV